MDEQSPTPELMIAAEVAELFGVHEGTVKAWARNDPAWIGALRTPGGQWRFRRVRVEEAREGHERGWPKRY